MIIGMKKRLKSVFSVVIAWIMMIGVSYVNDYYRASEEAIEALDGAYYYEENILIFEPEEVECGMIFYPGGKVQFESYVPLMQKCASEGILCVLIEMPCNLAVLDINAADGIQENFPDVSEWYMAGHSLGGSMAASYIEEHTKDFEGLILLASYSTENLTGSGLEILSVYGSQDCVLNKEKYEENKKNLPKEGFTELIIEGGCHAYFGNYGEQEGDGNAMITPEEQQKITVEAIKRFVK